MRPSSAEQKKRRQNRVPAVLPVRLRGTDAEGNPFEEIAHTLDITQTGARVAAIHQRLTIRDHVTIMYRRHRMEFVVVWSKQMSQSEYHAGLEAMAIENEAWGMKPPDFKVDVPCSGALTRILARL